LIHARARIKVVFDEQLTLRKPGTDVKIYEKTIE
jgi:hypothetical protein